MNFKNFHDVLNFAVKQEEAAIAGYGDLMEKTRLPGLKALLKELQEEERHHKQLLLHTGSKEIEEHEIHEVADLKISDYLVEESLDPDSRFQDLLIFAAKKEKAAVDLYTSLMKKVNRPEFKKLFEFLIEQEKSHKLKLETEYDKHILQED
jgi:rubrerythrin